MDTELTNGYTFQVHTLHYGDNLFQFGELSVPETDGQHPIAVLLHGGFWRARFGLDLLHDMSKELTSKGIAVWNVEYRRVGNEGGGWPGTLLDIAQAIDYLATIANEYKLDLQRCVFSGHSAGGQLALWAAARNHLPSTSQLTAVRSARFSPRAVISLAGVVDLEQAWQMRLGEGATAAFMGGAPAEYPERYASTSPARLLPLGVPQILIHGTQDQRVPLELSQAYAEQARAAGDEVTLIALSGVDHFALIRPESVAGARVIQEFQKLLL